MRPNSFYGNDHSNTLKLGRFALARLERAEGESPNADDDNVLPDCGGYWCACIWRNRSILPSQQSEAFAFGITLVDTVSAGVMFPALENVLSFQCSFPVPKLRKQYPMLEKIPEPILLVCSFFLQEKPEDRLLVEEFLDRPALHRKLCEQ